jgi:hypothetical protein
MALLKKSHLQKHHQLSSSMTLQMTLSAFIMRFTLQDGTRPACVGGCKNVFRDLLMSSCVPGSEPQKPPSGSWIFLREGALHPNYFWYLKITMDAKPS